MLLSRHVVEGYLLPMTFSTGKAAVGQRPSAVDFDLGGRVAVITGAARGIGHATAEAFAAHGATVIPVDRDWGDAALAIEGVTAEPISLDVSDSGAVDQAMAAVTAEHGGIDVLVNSAGIDARVPITEMTDEQWDRMLAVNLTGVFNLTRAVVPGMIERGFGRLINFGSNLGLLGSAGFGHYCASKGGVHSFTKAIARELAPDGITANVIAPGPVETPMLASLPRESVQAKLDEVPLNRAADPRAEIAPTAVMLASAAGAYYTGAILNVSGGDVMA